MRKRPETLHGIPERVEETIHRHGLLSDVRRLGLAVSGGADSLALLLLMTPICRSRGIELFVLTLDHGRPGEKEAADRVRTEAEALGLPVMQEHIRLETGEGVSLERAAREARMSFFAGCSGKLSLDAVATGHHADDVAETVFLRLCRGSGTTGLAGIRPVSRNGKLRFIRPLFHIGHRELCDWLSEQGRGWFEDPDNLSPEAARNRIRHVVFPALRETFDPALTQHLCSTAQLLSAEDELLETLAGEAMQRCTSGDALSIQALCGEPLALQRRVLRNWFYERDAASAVGLSRLDDLLALCTSDAPWIRTLPDGWRIESKNGRLIIGQTPQKGERTEPAPPCDLPIPGCVEWGDWTLSAEPIDLISSQTPGVGGSPAWVTIAKPPDGSCFTVRARRPGDRFSPFGMEGRKKLQDLFVDAKIPVEERSRIPVVVCGGEIVWVSGCRVSRLFAVSTRTTEMVCLRAWLSRGEAASLPLRRV